MLNLLISMDTGTYYLNLDPPPPPDIRSLIQNATVKDSFRTKVINMVDKKYKEAYSKSTHKKWFSQSLVEDFNKTESNLKLYINETIDINLY